MWSEADIPELAGVTAVVTGASSGIGLEVARGLASRGAHVKSEMTTWTWVLAPIPDGTTRLITRVRAPVSWRQPVSPVWLLMFEIADFPMMRKLLLGIKRRVEARTPAAQPA